MLLAHSLSVDVAIAVIKVLILDKMLAEVVVANLYDFLVIVGLIVKILLSEGEKTKLCTQYQIIVKVIVPLLTIMIFDIWEENMGQNRNISYFTLIPPFNKAAHKS